MSRPSPLNLAAAAIASPPAPSSTPRSKTPRAACWPPCMLPLAELWTLPLSLLCSPACVLPGAGLDWPGPIPAQAGVSAGVHAMLQLHVVEGPDKGARYPVGEAFALLLGRSRHSDTRLKDMSVSRVHAEVEVRGRRVLITDLESASGSYIN